MAATTPKKLSAAHRIGLAVEVEGSRAEIDRGIAWQRNHGVTVEPLEQNVIE